MADTDDKDLKLQVQEQDDGSATVHDPDDMSADGAQHDDDDDDDDAGAGADDTPAHVQAADDAAAAAGTTDPERKAIRERRRQERADKKTAQRQREDNLRHELSLRDAQINELREGFALLQRRANGTDLAQLDKAAQQAAEAADYYKNIIADATKKQDGAAVAEATEAMIRSRGEAERLRGIRQQLVNTASRPAPAQLDPRLKTNAEAWLSRNSWYSPSDAGSDAQVLRALDNAVASEGFDPRTPAYWNELDARLKKYLPHRAAGGSDSGYTGGTSARERQGTPVAGSGRDGRSAGGAGSPTGGSTYQLSAARVQALKEAGMWDDPKARADMIRRYREQDRQAAAR